MEYVATGIKKIKDKASGETRFVSVLIPLTEDTRVRAVNQAERIARRDRVTLESVLPVNRQNDTGGILTKETKKRKLKRAKR